MEGGICTEWEKQRGEKIQEDRGDERNVHTD